LWLRECEDLRVAEVGDAAGSGEARRRLPRWVAVALVVAIVAVVALAALGIAALVGDDDESQADRWEACARRVDPPADRSARLEEFSDREDEEAARERLADEIREVEQRIRAECGDRP
jgi:hypothetical protein